MDPPGLTGEVRKGLTGLVAQTDHVVEVAVVHRVQAPRALAGDIDAELVVQHTDGVGMKVGFGPDAGADHIEPPARMVAQQSLGNR